METASLYRRAETSLVQHDPRGTHCNSAQKNHCFFNINRQMSHYYCTKRKINVISLWNVRRFYPLMQSLIKVVSLPVTERYILVLCFQETKRMSTWSNHKSRRIQLSHEACGMNSVSNEAWPRRLVDVLLHIVYYFVSRRQSFQ